MIEHEDYPGLAYNSDTGEFWWRYRTSSRCNLGKPVGRADSYGSLRVMLGGKSIQLHRLAWFFCNGTWPTEQVDHINGVRTDNRISNLREATVAENQWNAKARSDNTSGIKGVSWDKQKGRWHARVKKNGKRYSKRFHEIEEAEAWIMGQRDQLHSEFARDE